MNIPERFWNTLTGLVGILTIFLIIFSIKAIKEIGYVGSNPDTTATIYVDGTGEAVAVPDIATFSFSVTETAKTVADAQTAATKKINSALKTVRDAGVADKDISTQSYSINPHYEYQNAVCPRAADGITVSYCPPGKSVLTGYDVSQSIQVKIRDLSKAGALFTSIGSVGVKNVNGLNFSVDDMDSVRATARDEAIADARAKARVLADKLGISLGRIISFSENNNSPRPAYYAMGKGGADMVSAEIAPEIPAGEQKITSTVMITYEIK